MMARNARDLARLVELALEATGGIRTMFATVVSVNGTSAVVRPDSADVGVEMGPLPVVAGNASAGGRVLVWFVPESNVWIIVGR